MTKYIELSTINDPASWKVDDVGIIHFATPEDAKKAEEIFNELSADACRYRWLKANEHADLAAELAFEVPGENWDVAIDRDMAQQYAAKESE